MTMRNRQNGNKAVEEEEHSIDLVDEDSDTDVDLSDDEDYEDDDDEEEYDDDKPLISYLFDKSFIGQHVIAIVIAFIGTCIGYSYNSPSSFPGDNFTPTPSSPSNNVIYAPNLAEEYHRKVLEERVHIAEYKRTANISFCEGDKLILEKHSDDEGLKTFEFRIPSKLGYIMKSYYAADFRRDDWSDKVTVPLSHEEEQQLLEKDQNYACLIEQINNEEKLYITGQALAYNEPHVTSLYRPPHPLSSDHSIQESKLSYTGFAAKFINLAPDTVHLYWDGPSDKYKFVAEIKPYETAGTATTPGQSFHISPPYDKSHALKRYTLTAHDALVYYDPYEDLKLEEKQEQIAQLSVEQKWKYDSHLVNKAFARYYLIHAGRLWLSQFPKPSSTHFMWSAQYFDQKHRVYTTHTHFTSMPPKEKLKIVSTAQMEELSKQQTKERHLKQYRAKELVLQLNAVSCAPRVFEIPNFLSSVEVQHLLDLGSNSTMKDSTVFPGGGSGDDDGKKNPRKQQRDKDTRSSTNTWLQRSTSPILDAIHRRASDVLKIDESFLRHHAAHDDLLYSTSSSVSEMVQLVRYKKGEEYKPHHDFTYSKIGSRYQPTRFATLIFYLTSLSSNEKEEGGRTTFPRALNAEFHDGIGVIPEAGKAVLFYNVLPDGNVDDWSVHGGEKVLGGSGGDDDDDSSDGGGGEKWIANLWVWDPVID